MKIVAAGEGALEGRIALLSIQDARPSLAFRLHVPVLVDDKKATLSVDLRHPEARSWRELAGRSYRFDESTRRYEKADGETYARDDVCADIRGESWYYDTYISRVTFGSRDGEHLPVTVEGTVRTAEGVAAFALDARVRVGGVVVEDGTAEDAVRRLDPEAYYPAAVRDGILTFQPKF